MLLLKKQHLGISCVFTIYYLYIAATETETIQYPESGHLHCKCDCLPFEEDRWRTLKTEITSIPLYRQDQKPNVYLFGAIQIDVFSSDEETFLILDFSVQRGVIN